MRAGRLNYVKRTPTPPPTNLTSPSGTSEEWNPPVHTTQDPPSLSTNLTSLRNTSLHCLSPTRQTIPTTTCRPLPAPANFTYTTDQPLATVHIHRAPGLLAATLVRPTTSHSPSYSEIEPLHRSHPDAISNRATCDRPGRNPNPLVRPHHGWR
jgi:hypothetical protein